MLVHAIHAAADFGDVIPLSPARTPFVGYNRATSDPEAIEKLWAEFPNAGIGLCAWSASLVAIDIEHERKKGEDGFATIAKLEQQLGALPSTRTHATKSGGEHRVYSISRDIQPIRSAQGVLKRDGISARGVDIVADRAVLRWPPTPGYSIKHAGEGFTMDGGGGCTPLPEAWVYALSDPPPKKAAPVDVDTHSDALVYALAALKAEAIELAQLSAGRNCALNASAYSLGQLSPPLTHAQIESILLACCEENGSLREHGQRACIQTIGRGARSGQRNPRQIRTRS